MKTKKWSAKSIALRVVIFVAASWVLAHFFALFGIFVAATYPLWWLLFPKKLWCVYCRVNRRNEGCPLCGQKAIGTVKNHPKSFKSAVLNGGVLFALSLVCLGLVYIEARLFERIIFNINPQTAGFFLFPRQEYVVGEVFELKVELVNLQTPVNAAKVDIGFDPDHLELVNINIENSFASVFTQKDVNNELGFARIVGGLPNPGFNQEAGEFAKVYFNPKITGLTKVEFLPSSMVLANDGRGTNVLRDFGEIIYLILPTQSRETAWQDERNEDSLLQFDVLGEASGNTKLRFYPTTPHESVLGETTDQNAQIGQDIADQNLVDQEQSDEGAKSYISELLNKIVSPVLTFFNKINHFILDFWKVGSR